MSKYTTKEISEQENVIEKDELVKKPSSKKKVFKQDDVIPCRSVVQGVLVLSGLKSKIPYKWTEYGDVTEVEYCDLVSLVREHSGYIFKPLFIIDDKDFVKEFPQLEKFYTSSYGVTELTNILLLPNDEMEEAIKTLPKTAADSLRNIAANQVSLGQIDSVSKIKALDRIFGTDLNLISEVLN